MGLSKGKVPGAIQKRFGLEDGTPEAFWKEHTARGRRGKGHMEQAVDKALRDLNNEGSDLVLKPFSRPYSHGWR